MMPLHDPRLKRAFGDHDNDTGFFNKIREFFNGEPINHTPKFKFPKKYYRGMGVDMVGRFLDDYRDVRDNSPWYVRGTLNFAMTTTEMGLTKGFSGWTEIEYDYISGMYFDTTPTSISGWMGYFTPNAL